MSENWICTQCMSPAKGIVCPQCGSVCEPARPIAQALPPQSILAGRYLVGGAVGGGGFGITYRALDLKNPDPESRIVAIKEYFPRSMAQRDGDLRVVPHEQHVQEFALWRDKIGQEYRTMVRLQNCDAVVHVRDVFGENDTVYLVMDFVQGDTLETRVRTGGPVPPEEVMRMLQLFLPQLHRMHAANVLHRDINPANIMLPPGQCPKLIDFGSARPNPRSGNAPLTVLVRRGYAPPEQHVRNGRQGAWSDVYGLCACMYFALTGVEPPDAQARRVHDTLVPLSELCPQAPDVLTEAIMQGLQLEIPLRLADFEQLWSLIAPAMPDEPELIDPPPEMEAPPVTQLYREPEPERPVTQLYREPQAQPVQESPAAAEGQKRLQAAMRAVTLLKIWNPRLAQRIALELEAMQLKGLDETGLERLNGIIREGGAIFSIVTEILFRK